LDHQLFKNKTEPSWLFRAGGFYKLL